MNRRSSIRFNLAVPILTIGLSGIITACVDQDAPAERQPVASVASDVGSLEVTVAVDSVDVRTLEYEITARSMTAIKGRIDAAPPGSSASLVLSGIPAGRDAAISLAGRSEDGTTTCRGNALLEMVAGKRSGVQMALLCRTSNESAPTSVDGRLRSCPVIDSYTASARTTTVAEPIVLQASASDRDAMDVLRFRWSAPVGSFSADKQGYTRYECTKPGDRMITLSVNDGWCTYIVGFSVSCKATPEGAVPALSWR